MIVSLAESPCATSVNPARLVVMFRPRVAYPKSILEFEFCFGIDEFATQ